MGLLLGLNIRFLILAHKQAGELSLLMSALTNPFAQIGDYWENTSFQNEDLVTTAYLTGLPNPKNISDSAANLIFKQLLKRDARTKLRAIKDLEQWLSELNSNEQIEDSVHLSFIQLYAKLSNDISPQIRHESQLALCKLYSILGKKSSKYLKYSVGPWIVNQWDPDLRAANAAQNALRTIFPGEKAALLVKKFQSPIREYIYDCCNNATAQSLSDERYLTKEEASQKYTRMVRCCLNTLIEEPTLFDLEVKEIADLIYSGRLWKFFSSSDTGLARSALKLATKNLKILENEVPNIWKELLRTGRKNSGGLGVALDVIQLMNIMTKSYPQQTWSSDENTRRDAIASLGQFVISDPPHPSNFWPLLYNLLLMIPEPPSRDLTPLYKPIEKVVLRLQHNHELEESVWGCFVSLAGKMGPKYIQRVFRTVEKRCQGPNVPIKSIAKYLSRFADTDGVSQVVRSQLLRVNSSECPLEYTFILAATRKFAPEIEKFVMPNLSVKDIALLVDADPNLHIPEMDFVPDAAWLAIATKSANVDAQNIVETLASQNMELEVLESSKSLSKAGVKFSLDQFVLDNLTDKRVVEAAIVAQGELVSVGTAQMALKHVVDLALQDHDETSWAFRILRLNPAFAQNVASADNDFAEELNMLAMEDERGILQEFKSLKLSSSKKFQVEKGEQGIDFIRNLSLQTLDLSVPEDSIVNPLRVVPPFTKYDHEEALVQCFGLNIHLESAFEFIRQKTLAYLVDAETLSKILILQEYVKSWLLKFSIEQANILKNRSVDGKTAFKQLWEQLESSNAGVAYHAALALEHRQFASQVTAIPYECRYFSTPSLKGAIMARFSAVKNNIQYDNMQRSLVREAKVLRLKANEWMLIDQSFLTEHDVIEVATDDSENSVRTAVFAILTFRSAVSNIYDLAFQSANPRIEYAAILSLSDIENMDELLNYLINLPLEDVKSGIIASKCLSLVNAHLSSHDSVSIADKNLLDILLKSGEISLCWIALQLLRNCEDVPYLSLQLDGILDEPRVLVSWLIQLLTLDGSKDSELPLRHVFTWIVEQLKECISSSSDIDSAGIVPPTPASTKTLALNMLYMLSNKRPNDVRQWYRDIRDKSLLKCIDNALSTVIVPAILRSVRMSLSLQSFAEEVQVSVNERQREIRASRAIEDDYTADIIIALPDQFPGKPAIMSFRNLGSVSEAKKRGWLLEARQKLQRGGILAALNSLLQRLENFLDGIEPCAICYMTVNGNNKLPNKDCFQCRNIYHSDCLYKWFSTNGNKLCPMCRTQM